jgi:hypothetical protein
MPHIELTAAFFNVRTIRYSAAFSMLYYLNGLKGKAIPVTGRKGP